MRARLLSRPHPFAYTREMALRTVAWVTIGITSILGLAVIAITVGGSPASEGRVYSVREVVAGLRRQPQVWIGKTILVQGRDTVTTFSCASGQCSLPSWTLTPGCDPACATWELLEPPGPVDVGGHRPTLSLRLPHVNDDRSSIVAVLRNIPIISRFFTSAATFPSPYVQTYRIRLYRPQACNSFPLPAPPCAPQGVRV